ncbi:MAG: A/G-specific adenine glycosylase [Halothiobacillus sp.]|jgi:A/G-specific adenine glycosylase|nr:A/G-specific adenine glycosylase [Halothiobacillus sp.]
MSEALHQPPFADRLLCWFDVHGRHDLPWQHPRTPYRVWVSEVMLQQTQVATVIDYFNRFMARFPTLDDLAQASMDDVLALWSGLGYYARGRNLHAAARVMARQGIPETLAHWLALPGVGSSTAAAIIAQAFDEPATILDGNVKRVIARHAGIDTPIEQSGTIQTLYHIAKEYTPHSRFADYTQAIMDLGATLCTRSRPACDACPVAEDCVARQTARVEELPARRRRVAVPTRQGSFLLIQDQARRVLLTRRPPTGIWGGLWCLPESSSQDAVMCSDSVGVDPWHVPWALTPQSDQTRVAHFQHRFTHFVLDASVHRFSVNTHPADADPAETMWLDLAQYRQDMMQLGLPKPIQRLLMTESLDSMCPVTLSPSPDTLGSAPFLSSH